MPQSTSSFFHGVPNVTGIASWPASVSWSTTNRDRIPVYQGKKKKWAIVEVLSCRQLRTVNGYGSLNLEKGKSGERNPKAIWWQDSVAYPASGIYASFSDSRSFYWNSMSRMVNSTRTRHLLDTSCPDRHRICSSVSQNHFLPVICKILYTAA